MSEPREPQGPIAIDSVPWEEFSHGVRFGNRFRVLSSTRGERRSKIGVSYEELPPGKQSVPFHYHLTEEEHIVALEGECTLRLGEARYALRAGDYVGFPAGQRAGHCLINETDKPFRFLMIGDHDDNEVAVYPDSGKVLIRGLDRAIVRDDNRLDYFDGENADEPPPRAT
ncbi:MAG: cupin domain-containing protein [Labilithrix sp.]|nr:cupin domain-containing protein [Labilithrix sp.]